MALSSTDLAYLDAAISNICRLIAEVTESPRPDYSVNGRSVSMASYLSTLIERLATLRRMRNSQMTFIWLGTDYNTTLPTVQVLPEWVREYAVPVI